MQQQKLIVYDIAKKTGTSIRKTRKIIIEYIQIARELIASGVNFNLPKIGIIKIIRNKGTRRGFFKGKMITYPKKDRVRFETSSKLLREINENGKE